MRLFEEALGALGISQDVVNGGAKVVVMTGVCACLENVKGITLLTAEQVNVKTRGGEVRIYGKGLVVARYGLGDL